jgi:hypothetical protein
MIAVLDDDYMVVVYFDDPPLRSSGSAFSRMINIGSLIESPPESFSLLVQAHCLVSYLNFHQPILPTKYAHWMIQRALKRRPVIEAGAGLNPAAATYILI